jgi:DNA recombination-dependent growth factor C
MELNGVQWIKKNKKFKRKSKLGMPAKNDASSNKVAKYLNNGDVPDAILAHQRRISFVTNNDRLINRINFLEVFIKTSEHKGTVTKAKKELKLLMKEYMHV